MRGRTYRFFEGEPLFPFGFGLSYTTFAYRNLSLPKQAKAGDSVKVSVEVQNTGAAAGDEVVQLYLKSGRAGEPLRSLEAFERITLRPKERKTVQFTLQARQLGRNIARGYVVEPGTLDISVGGRQPDATSAGVLTGSLQIKGTKRVTNQVD
jgi:beta-glucosidase